MTDIFENVFNEQEFTVTVMSKNTKMEITERHKFPSFFDFTKEFWDYHDFTAFVKLSIFWNSDDGAILAIEEKRCIIFIKK